MFHTSHLSGGGEGSGCLASRLAICFTLVTSLEEKESVCLASCLVICFTLVTSSEEERDLVVLLVVWLYLSH